jgi:hypothetical protein
MKLEPNVGKGYRVYCIVVGVALCIAPFLLTVPTWVKVAVPILGIFSLATGLAGW